MRSSQVYSSSNFHTSLNQGDRDILVRLKCSTFYLGRVMSSPFTHLSSWSFSSASNSIARFLESSGISAGRSARWSSHPCTYQKLKLVKVKFKLWQYTILLRVLFWHYAQKNRLVSNLSSLIKWTLNYKMRFFKWKFWTIYSLNKFFFCFLINSIGWSGRSRKENT